MSAATAREGDTVGSLVHPEHDTLVQVVRGWYTTSSPAIDFEVAEHWFGHLSEVSALGAGRLILSVDAVDQVTAALDEALRLRGSKALTIWVDDRARAARLDAALQAHGCQLSTATTHLALLGDLVRDRDLAVGGGARDPDRAVGDRAEVGALKDGDTHDRTGAGSLVLESIDRSRLEEWAAVKVMCFDDTESTPAAERVTEEVTIREAEMPLADYKLALMDGEAVGVLAYYTGLDQLVFNLGTRLPFRHRGIAQAMLGEWVDAGRAAGCRSFMINAHDDGRPAALYRRIGFGDEIYWYQKYELVAE